MPTHEVYDAHGNLLSTVPPTAEDLNADTIRAQAAQAMAVNRAFIARGTANTAAQVRDQTILLTRETQALIRLALNLLDGTD